MAGTSEQTLNKSNLKMHENSIKVLLSSSECLGSTKTKRVSIKKSKLMVGTVAPAPLFHRKFGVKKQAIKRKKREHTELTRYYWVLATQKVVFHPFLKRQNARITLMGVI